LDTALALSTLRNTDWSDYSSALAYLKSSQNSNGGWSLGTGAASDPLTTAIVTQTLCRYQALDATVDTTVANAEGYLSGQVDVGDSTLLRAETALALLPNGRQSAKVVALLDALQNDQDAQGHWDNDIYSTARVVRAMAMALGKDPDAPAPLSGVCDADLRSALNNTLSKNAADALTVSEMRDITSISAAGAGIADLCGLEDAQNLTYADLRNNQITSLLPLVGLANLQTVLLNGNPLSDTEDADGDGHSDLAELQAGTNPLDAGSVPTATPVPAVNIPAMLITFLLLVLLIAWKSNQTLFRNRQV
jgi:hypothetical protein